MKQYINITETLKRYERALKAISKASDQANAIHLKTVAQTALDFEPTTADEFNMEEHELLLELESKKDPNDFIIERDPGDEHMGSY